MKKFSSHCSIIFSNPGELNNVVTMSRKNKDNPKILDNRLEVRFTNLEHGKHYFTIYFYDKGILTTRFSGFFCTTPKNRDGLVLLR